MSYTHMLKPLR